MRRLTTLLISALAGAALLPAAASADVLVTVDKAAQRMTVAVDGQDRYSWPVSTGVADHDTPSGSFQPMRLDRDHFSREWDDAPMPYSIFFTGMGHAIHGTGHVAALGRPASHGCVRLSRPHAAELFALVKAEGLGNTRVVIEGDDAGIAEPADTTPGLARYDRTRYGQDVDGDGGLYAEDAPSIAPPRGRRAGRLRAVAPPTDELYEGDDLGAPR
ncbi:murein L,D-transpeptidase [Lichenibacterium minor]|jgi:hypothetical protein|uniref:Murein L,D-transpeptidase n=1 Tax=Lichenibacterium minor TaxID=2316528 RepID=A0A4Q2UAQ7_9HYPH|nr:L,D-transpeptidase [Lichenibacterium minor]RYC32207.1 murein L,D-transpeptidase [Lichenibacterium minor]